MLETAIVSAPESSDLNSTWIEALPARTYVTPQYGEIPITVEKLDRMVKNFNSRVRGQDVATDFDHGMDRSKGNQASGWYKELAIRPSSNDPAQFSLWANIEFTDDAKAEIESKKWKYFSLEWDDAWTANDGTVVNDVIIGGGLTNRPIAKGTLPINFSEAMWDGLDDVTKMRFAVWSTAYVNNLPDSAFLYISPGGKKDGEGKTTPRSLRHLPYKDANGKVDLPHLRNAIARAPQMKGIPQSVISGAQARARRLLGGASKAKAASEEAWNAWQLLSNAGLDVEFSEAGWEHNEPGLGMVAEQIDSAMDQPDPGTGQYVPRQQGSSTWDKAVEEGWRWQTLPSSSTDPDQPVAQPPYPVSLSEGGETVLTDEERNELMKLLGVTSESEFMPEARKAFGELAALKSTVGLADQERKFAEQFPAVWREHQALLEVNRTTNAKAFSESVQRVKRVNGESLEPTRSGLSALALEKLTEVHKKFAEGSVTVTDFEDAVRTIMDGGIVEFGEVGSSIDVEPVAIDTSTTQGIANTRKLFAEKIAEVQKNNKDMNFQQAIVEAGKLYPDLAEAYRVAGA